MSLANNVDFLRRVSKLNGFGFYGRSQTHGPRSPLVRVREFGENPGALKMFSYVPANLPRKPALVVVLHGCGQTADGYDVGTGWSTLGQALRLCAADAGAALRQQRQHLLQLVQSGRHCARSAAKPPRSGR